MFVTGDNLPSMNPVWILSYKNQDRIRATTDRGDFVCTTDITFIAVGTPSHTDGSIDLTFAFRVCEEIGNLCKKMGIDSDAVIQGVGMDSRISPAFFRSGIGFGGSCFSKDVRALLTGARAREENLSILEAVCTATDALPL